MESVYRQLCDLSKTVKEQTESKIHDTKVFDQNYEKFARDSVYISKIRKDYKNKRGFYEDRVSDSKKMRSDIQRTKREVNKNLDDAVLTLVKNEKVLENVAKNINRPKIGSLEALARETVQTHAYSEIPDMVKEVLAQPYKEKYVPISPKKSNRRVISVRKTKSFGGKSRRRKSRHGI
jgi:uncharacterized protein YeeX (DUF496 family)